MDEKSFIRFGGAVGNDILRMMRVYVRQGYDVFEVFEYKCERVECEVVVV